jgi:uroporphyrinogen III methyltransferase / synthase
MPYLIPSSKCLLDKTILVACSSKKMVELIEGLEALGGKALPFPVIEAKDIDDKRPMDRAVSSLSQYAWIIFTSAFGVTFFMRHMQERGIDRHFLDNLKICAVGPATAGALKAYDLNVALVPEKYVAEGVIQALERYHGGLQSLAGHRILLPRAREARDVLPNALMAAGVQLDVVPCYQTVRTELDEAIVQEFRTKAPDLIVFTSSSTVRNLIEILGQETWNKMVKDSIVAAIGPITAGTVEAFGKRVDIVPREYAIASLIAAIREYYVSRQQFKGSGQQEVGGK